jgi:hypothetical protein
MAMRRAALMTVAAAALLAGAHPGVAAATDFAWSPNPAVVDEQTVFSAVQDPSITFYAWDLDGDGSYNGSSDASGPEVTRIFQRIRTYTIGLATVDDQGNVSEEVKSVPVVAPPGPDNRPPTASFVFFPAGPIAGEPITFVSTSTDPDSPIPGSSLHWDLNGDGAFDDAEGSSATTSFATPGTYSVSLRITTSAMDVATLVLNVGTLGTPGSSVGQRGLSLLSPFPVIRIAGRTSRRGARIRSLTVDAPPGTAVKVRCTGRGCPFKRVLRRVSTRVVAGRGLPPSRVLRVRRLEGALLRTGTTLRLFVTREDAVGKFTRFRIRRGKPPSRTDLCLVPGSGRPLACPAR